VTTPPPDGPHRTSKRPTPHGLPDRRGQRVISALAVAAALCGVGGAALLQVVAGPSPAQDVRKTTVATSTTPTPGGGYVLGSRNIPVGTGGVSPASLRPTPVPSELPAPRTSGTPKAGSGPTTTPVASATIAGGAAVARELYRLINEQRSTVGCAPLGWDDRLAAAARAHSVDMSSTGVVSHRGSDGSTEVSRITAAGYEFDRVGETVAGGRATPGEALAVWLAGPTSRGVLLDCGLRDVGIGYAAGGPLGSSWTADLAVPWPAPAAKPGVPQQRSHSTTVHPATRGPATTATGPSGRSSVTRRERRRPSAASSGRRSPRGR